MFLIENFLHSVSSPIHSIYRLMSVLPTSHVILCFACLVVEIFFYVSLMPVISAQVNSQNVECFSKLGRISVFTWKIGAIQSSTSLPFPFIWPCAYISLLFRMGMSFPKEVLFVLWQWKLVVCFTLSTLKLLMDQHFSFWLHLFPFLSFLSRNSFQMKQRNSSKGGRRKRDSSMKEKADAPEKQAMTGTVIWQ